MIEMFENNKVFIAPDTNVNKLLDKGWSEEDIEKEIERLSEENPKNQTFKSSNFKDGFIERLERHWKRPENGCFHYTTHQTIPEQENQCRRQIGHLLRI